MLQLESMLELGLHASGGSDCPVEPFDILDNLRAAVTRQNRAGTKTYLLEQALTVEEGAAAVHLRRRLGQPGRGGPGHPGGGQAG